MLNVLTCTIQSVNGTTEIPTQLVGVVRLIFNLIKIGVPLLLVIYGMLDFGKAVMSQDEKEIKTKESLFIKRLIAGALVFFVLFIVQLLLGVVGETGDGSVWSTVSCVLSGK